MSGTRDKDQIFLTVPQWYIYEDTWKIYIYLHKDIHSYIYGIHICMEDLILYMCMYIHIYIYRCTHVHIIIEYIYLTYNKIITPASNFLSLSFFSHHLPSYPWFSPRPPSYILFLLSLIFLSLSFFTHLLFPPSLLSSLTSSYSLPFLLPPHPAFFPVLFSQDGKPISCTFLS